MYYVFHASHGETIISKSNKNDSYEANLSGEYRTFREAKNAAIEMQKITTDNFKSDLEMAKTSLSELRSLKKCEVDNEKK